MQSPLPPSSLTQTDLFSLLLRHEGLKSNESSLSLLILQHQRQLESLCDQLKLLSDRKELVQRELEATQKVQEQVIREREYCEVKMKEMARAAQVAAQGRQEMMPMVRVKQEISDASNSRQQQIHAVEQIPDTLQEEAKVAEESKDEEHKEETKEESQNLQDQEEFKMDNMQEQEQEIEITNTTISEKEAIIQEAMKLIQNPIVKMTQGPPCRLFQLIKYQEVKMKYPKLSHKYIRFKIQDMYNALSPRERQVYKVASELQNVQYFKAHPVVAQRDPFEPISINVYSHIGCDRQAARSDFRLQNYVKMQYERYCNFLVEKRKVLQETGKYEYNFFELEPYTEAQQAKRFSKAYSKANVLAIRKAPIQNSTIQYPYNLGFFQPNKRPNQQQI